MLDRRTPPLCRLSAEALRRSRQAYRRTAHQTELLLRRDGCRKRLTPPSVRFLGRKVYLGAIVMLVTAMRQGPTPRRVRELSARFGVDRRTIARWQVFWREHFPQTHFGKSHAPVWHRLSRSRLPYSLVDAFLSRHPDRMGWTLLLRFLAPITITGGL